MAATNEIPTTNVVDSKYFAAPHSIDPLPHTIRLGLIAVGICGLASFLSTLTLFSFLFYRLFTWRTHYKTFLGYNQYVVLFLNLIFADLFQASAFVISFYWIEKNAILAPTAACATQGFLLHFGDIASAFFVLSIAVHTFVSAARGVRIAYSTFFIGVWLVWLGAFFLTILGVAIYKDKYFVRAGAWCWVSDDYEPERLGLHYFWLFFSMFGVTVIYLLTFFQLRHKTTQLFAEQRRASNELANKSTVEAVNRITKLMMLYPFVYVLLTLPISACRMWSMAHDGEMVSEVTQCIVGALLASCGWADCLLYSLTRKRLMRETMGGGNGCSHGSRSRSQDAREPESPSSIVRTTSIEVRSEIFDASNGRQMPPPLVYSEISAGSGTPRQSRSERRAESKTQDRVYERPPSPQRFADAGYARSGKAGSISHCLKRDPSVSKQLERPVSVELRSVARLNGGSFYWRDDDLVLIV
jgi:hypothetical protein